MLMLSKIGLCCTTLIVPLAGCDLAHPRLHGHVPSEPRHVGDIVLPEVSVNGPDRPFSFRAEPGRLLVVYFGYTSCPDVCPTTLSDLRQALGALGSDAGRVDVAFVSVDPRRDSAAVLVPYLQYFARAAHAVRPHTQAELARAERAFGASSSVATLDDGTVEVMHSALTSVVDASGRVRVVWDFGTKPGSMTEDLRLLLAVKAGGDQ